MDLNEETLLVSRLKEGDETAYRCLFDHHYAPLCHVAFRYVGDRHLAEWLVGDVIFRLWQRRTSLSIDSSLRSYLMTSVRNRCLDHLKSRAVRTETGLDQIDRNLAAGASPLGSLLEKELENAIMDSIEALPDKTREVFKLSRFAEMKYEEIAGKLDISLNTVKYHMKAALAALREDLDKYLALAFLLFLFRG